MLRIAWIAATAALLASPDVSHALQARPPVGDEQIIPANESIPVLPNFGTAQSDQQTDQPQTPAADAPAGPLTEEARLNLIRYVSGEFARMTTSLPAGKTGFHIKAGQPLDRGDLQKAIQSNGAVLNAGDNIQITRIEFERDQIRVEVNGGPSGGQSWRNRVRLTTGPDVPVTSGTTTSPDAPVVLPTVGAVLFLDFDKPLPNLSPDQLKKYLSVVFDFSRQRSAAVEWAATLPPKIREAVEQKRPEIGMDREEILAAMGRPDRKVREQEEDGAESEDWIYGHPPTKTIFVRFSGDKVVKIDQYPHP